MKRTRKTQKADSGDEAAPPAKRSKKEEDEEEEDGWKMITVEAQEKPTLLYASFGAVKGSTKIASFDLDDTLIETKSGEKFAKNGSDWKFVSDDIVPKIEALHKDGHKIVIFTNQAGLTKGKQDIGSLQSRIAAVVKALGVPVQVFAAIADDLCRKPCSTMWKLMVKEYNDGIVPVTDSCVFVGDAAGRPKSGKRPADFSASDIKFAKNCGIPFKTPEEFFNKRKPAKADATPAESVWMTFDPKKILEAAPKALPCTEYHKKDQKEVVICVGYPGCGKSSFSKKMFVPHGYVWVNQDTLGTADRCARECRTALTEGKSVVVDNTNPSKDHRQMYARIAKEKGATARIFFFNSNYDLAWHMNVLRERSSGGKFKRVPQIAYNQFKGQFEAPSKDEKGIEELVVIPFCPSFVSAQEEEIFMELS